MTNIQVFICSLCGLISGFLIGIITEYYTSNEFYPVQELSESCKKGAAPNIIKGLALGYMSCVVPIFCLAITIYVSFKLADMYGIAVAALGMLSNLCIALAIDGYGPIRAKFDTGNGTKASLFVVDELEVKGKEVIWAKDGKKFKNKLMGMSHPAHVGKIDERPIVHLSVRFNNKLYNDVPFGLSTKDSMSTVLINRELLTRFKVSVSPIRRFVLSDWIQRAEQNDDDG